jgi:hypothetical protein
MPGGWLFCAAGMREASLIAIAVGGAFLIKNWYKPKILICVILQFVAH